MEVYVDDLLVKRLTSGNHVADLADAFDTLRKYHMKLNPQKCAFGVDSGMFLGFMVSQRESRRILTRLGLSYKCRPLGQRNNCSS